jgi:hypothetical protein
MLFVSTYNHSGGLHATGVAKTDYWSGPHVGVKIVVHYGAIASDNQLVRQSEDPLHDCWLQLLYELLLNGLTLRLFDMTVPRCGLDGWLFLCAALQQTAAFTGITRDLNLFHLLLNRSTFYRP